MSGTRRDILKVLGASTIMAIPYGLSSAPSVYPNKKLKIMITGAHPDDPETGCGGTIARCTQAGHEVIILYLTRGEAGIEGTSNEDSARIRTGEAKKACDILNARPLFAGQIDGSTKVSPRNYNKIRTVINKEKPEVLFTQWPVDSHRDHRALSLLVYDTWLSNGKKIPLYYYEVMTGEQTQTFHPTHYIDISQTKEIKRQACFAHKSQKPEEWYHIHEEMSHFRGMEYRCEHAEAFIRHEQSPSSPLIDSE